MHIVKQLTAAAFACLSLAPEAVAAQSMAKASPVTAISTDTFAQRPLVAGPKLSPDGTKVLSKLSIRGEQHLGIVGLDGSGTKALALPAGTELETFAWAGNKRVLISVGATIRYYGNEAYKTQLVAYDVETGQPVALGNVEKQGLEGDDILYVDPDGAWLLLSVQKTPTEWPSVQKVDLATGDMSQVMSGREGVVEWFADDRGIVRAGIGVNQFTWFLIYRGAGERDLKEVARYRYEDTKAELGLLRFAFDSDQGYILSDQKTGRQALYNYNFATQTLGEPVFEHATNDLDDFALNEDGKTVKAIFYADDRDRVKWLDSKMEALQAKLDQSFPGREAWIVSRSKDDSKLIVWTGSSADPGEYFLYDVASGATSRLAYVNEGLDAGALSPSRYVDYTARDGTKIHAYLTLPKGREAKGLPLIVMPHGGPYGVRDLGKYDAEVQFLANRGYAVLQPNFRGSSSYGTEFTRKGEGEWGRKMQDDLDDGMDWLVKQGMVDASRVCMVGSSYGGYAALWGATRNPERYRCAASFAGVSDIKRQLSYSKDFFVSRKTGKAWRNRVRGDRNFDLDTVSPLANVERLRVPVLVAHGDEDQRVPVKQSTLYVKALKQAGKPHESVIYKAEGHGFSTASNLKDYLDRLGKFLATHNPS